MCLCLGTATPPVSGLGVLHVLGGEIDVQGGKESRFQPISFSLTG
jgi:hypothetical protein